MESVEQFFRWLDDAHGIKLTIFYDDFDRARFFNGFLTSLGLMAICLVLASRSAWSAPGCRARARGAAAVVRGYIQFFRNTPPLVQLYFFYFALGSYPAQLPGDRAWRCRSCQQFHLGGDLASRSTPARSTSRFSAPASRRCRATRSRPPRASATRRLQAYRHVILPLAFRISLPALNNNLVNLVKTTTIAYAIAVPEMLYVANQIWSDELERAAR